MKKIMLGTSDAWSTSHSSQQPSEPEYHIIDCRIFRWWWWYYDWWRKSHALRGGSSFEEIDRRLCHRWWHSRQRPPGLFGRPLCLPAAGWLAGWLAGHSVLGRAVKASRPEPMPLENLSTLATTKKTHQTLKWEKANNEKELDQNAVSRFWLQQPPSR